MGYLLEFRLLPESLDTLIGNGGVSAVDDVDSLPLIGALQHASASGDAFRECLTDAVGEALVDALLSRDGVDPLPGEGAYPSFGGLGRSEMETALEQVAVRIDSAEPFAHDDWRTWTFELRHILSEALDNEQDIITSYR